jgi:hypothetical protein
MVLTSILNLGATQWNEIQFSEQKNGRVRKKSKKTIDTARRKKKDFQVLLKEGCHSVGFRKNY